METAKPTFDIFSICGNEIPLEDKSGHLDSDIIMGGDIPIDNIYRLSKKPELKNEFLTPEFVDKVKASFKTFEEALFTYIEHYQADKGKEVQLAVITSQSFGLFSNAPTNGTIRGICRIHTDREDDGGKFFAEFTRGETGLYLPFLPSNMKYMFIQERTTHPGIFHPPQYLDKYVRAKQVDYKNFLGTTPLIIETKNPNQVILIIDGSVIDTLVASCDEANLELYYELGIVLNDVIKMVLQEGMKWLYRKQYYALNIRLANILTINMNRDNERMAELYYRRYSTDLNRDLTITSSQEEIEKSILTKVHKYLEEPRDIKDDQIIPFEAYLNSRCFGWDIMNRMIYQGE